jgi:hypothetical protein
VRLTRSGSAKYQAIDERQASWVNRLVRGVSRSDLDTTRRVLDELSDRLEADRHDEAEETKQRLR